MCCRTLYSVLIVFNTIRKSMVVLCSLLGGRSPHASISHPGKHNPSKQGAAICRGVITCDVKHDPVCWRRVNTDHSDTSPWRRLQFPPRWNLTDRLFGFERSSLWSHAAFGKQGVMRIARPPDEWWEDVEKGPQRWQMVASGDRVAACVSVRH